ncbi:MAG: DUF5655 domain-containing protein [Chitinivibrionales bacterium]
MDKTTASFVKAIKPKIANFKARSINEAQTKEWLIKPFFETLGWDFSNPDEVIPEDDDSTGKKPDYSFTIDGNAKFLVEAKPISNPLTDNKMITEKLNYCLNSQVPFLIITNGELYKIYYVELKGVGKDKLLQEFSISDEYDDEILEMLSKSAFGQDHLHTYAKNIFIYTNVKTALENLLHDPSKKIIDILNNSIKENLGHKFGDDEIDEALKNITVTVNTDFNEQKVTEKEKRESLVDKEKWTTAFQFKDGKWDVSQQLYMDLVKEAKKAGIEFEENPTKFYIGWIGAGKNFCQVHGQKSGMKIWVTCKMTDLTEQETLKVRDVSQIGHWGMGDIEFSLNNLKDFEWAINIIKKAYSKGLK